MPPIRTSTKQQQQSGLRKRDCDRQSKTERQAQRRLAPHAKPIVLVRAIAAPPTKVSSGMQSTQPARPASTQVIELSSDDEDEAPRRQPAPAPVNAVVSPIRLEAHSERPMYEPAELLKAVEGLEQMFVKVCQKHIFEPIEEAKQECERYKELYLSEQTKKDDALRQVQEVENNLQREIQNRPVPDYTELDEATTCGICTRRMWQPATLHECGHTFCNTCLRGWINTINNAHIRANPAFLEGPPIPVQYVGRTNDPRVAQVIEGIKAEWRQRVPQPVYTCPKCRVQTKTSPLVVYNLKEMVRKVARLVDGEGEEQREGSAGERN